MVQVERNDSVLRQICPPSRQGSSRQMGRGSDMLRWWGLAGAPAPSAATLTGPDESRLLPAPPVTSTPAAPPPLATA